jgi:hypothetical protein
MTVTARLGTAPTMREDLDRALDLIAKQADVIAALAGRIEVLEAARDVDDQVDGSTPQALPPNWRPIKKAAPIVGYSEPGLRKAMRRHTDGPRWWRYVGARLLIDVDRCPRRPVRT